MQSRTEIYKQLNAPFPLGEIMWRLGATNKDKTKGVALAYIDARTVMNRLDAVLGFESWQTKARKDGDTYYCELSVRIDGEWITKTDAAGATQVEEQKGGASDAFKRAAVSFGIGRYLYDLQSPWVEIEPYGKSYRIKETEYHKLNKVLGATKNVA